MYLHVQPWSDGGLCIYMSNWVVMTGCASVHSHAFLSVGLDAICLLSMCSVLVHICESVCTRKVALEAIPLHKANCCLFVTPLGGL